jgi:hypothetical protein
MHRLLPALVLAALLAGLTTPARQSHAAQPKAGEFFFQPGDRIVFLGDSISRSSWSGSNWDGPTDRPSRPKPSA